MCVQVGASLVIVILCTGGGILMIFTFLVDKTVCVYSSPDEIPNDIEPSLVDDVLQSVFDETGRRYAVEWVKPNRRGRFLGLVPWTSNGQYRIVPTEINDREGLLQAIRNVSIIEPKSTQSYHRKLGLRLTR